MIDVGKPRHLSQHSGTNSFSLHVLLGFNSQIIRSPSRSRDRATNAAAAQQNAAAAAVPPHMVSSGRGGAGNVRSPSRDPLDRKKAAEAQEREVKLQEEYRQHELKSTHTTGRGGAGNMTAEAAEERGRGRGGAGSNGGSGGGVSGVSELDFRE